MKRNYEMFHQAVCSECGHIERQSDTGAFIDTFFLPSICPICGEYPDWIDRTKTIKRVPAKRSLWKPWTWFYFDRWVDVEIHDSNARSL